MEVEDAAAAGAGGGEAAEAPAPTPMSKADEEAAAAVSAISQLVDKPEDGSEEVVSDGEKAVDEADEEAEAEAGGAGPPFFER